MNAFYFFLIFASSISIPLLDNVYGETFDINMPTGSASPDAPYFWQNEKTGEATGDIEISIGDTVVWKNGDGAKHTITSGTVETGPDGIFGGTDFLVPGEFYTFTFDKKGVYPYYCIIHPWMIGSVTVTDGYKIFPNVGKNTGDGLTTFNVEYQYNGIISEVKVNEEAKSITLILINDEKSNDRNLTMLLHSELIAGPYVILVDGKKNLNFEYLQNEVNTIDIELPDDSKEITIIGTKIVPEFGILSVIVLGVAITSMIFLQKSRIDTNF